ncbi:jg20630 [Pararge aegeria aegeria]|uniref:Jg20630 protein n=1 Tax=Pararge aegeria aegeria TaxID=348720 RepID=A0A8S4RD66_9NEOP|nr:jg20630 [Pararge aegeria aegeria]
MAKALSERESLSPDGLVIAIGGSSSTLLPVLRESPRTSPAGRAASSEVVSFDGVCPVDTSFGQTNTAFTGAGSPGVAELLEAPLGPNVHRFTKLCALPLQLKDSLS